tara:strand:- start:278 stop:793 length:516 start_codon:yes stop_codon:yes gene_type:complete
MKHDLFITSVHQFHVDEWTSNRDRILDMIPDSNDCEKHTKYSDYLEPYKNIEYRKEFLKFIEPYIKKFAETSVYKFSNLTNMWCQKYVKRDYIVPHDHGGVGYACIFYAKLSEDHDGTLFFANFPDETGIRDCKTVPVVEGDLLFFPSNLMHCSIPHDSEDERVIISFNLQ